LIVHENALTTSNIFDRFIAYLRQMIFVVFHSNNSICIRYLKTFSFHYKQRVSTYPHWHFVWLSPL